MSGRFPSRKITWFNYTLFFKPLSHKVLIVEISCGRIHHALRTLQTVLTPANTAFNHPTQYRRPFVFKFVFKVAVWCIGLAREWNNVESPHGSIINIMKKRLVVPHNHQFELRLIGEKVLPHKTCCNGVAASHLFDPAFSPSTAFFSLRCTHQTSTTQHGKVSWVAVTLRRCEGVH